MACVRSRAIKVRGDWRVIKAGARCPGSGQCSFNGNSEQQEKHKVSDNQRYGIGLALVLIAGSVMAEDLPQQSILKRYGVTPTSYRSLRRRVAKRRSPNRAAAFISMRNGLGRT